MTSLIEIHTGRLFLRQWRAADRKPFAAMNADPEVMRYFPATLTSEQSDAMADRCQKLLESRGWGLWAVETTAEKIFIGFVGLSIPVVDLPFMPCVEIGWRLATTAWGKGYATEAARAALRVGFVDLQLAKIVSFTSVINARSRAVMERLGMTEAAATFEHLRLSAVLCESTAFIEFHAIIGQKTRPEDILYHCNLFFFVQIWQHRLCCMRTKRQGLLRC